MLFCMCFLNKFPNTLLAFAVNPTTLQDISSKKKNRWKKKLSSLETKCLSLFYGPKSCCTFAEFELFSSLY